MIINILNYQLYSCDLKNIFNFGNFKYKFNFGNLKNIFNFILNLFILRVI